MAIAISGAGGQLGRGVLRHAAARVAPSDIIAVTRDPQKLESAAPRGVRIRKGDFRDPSSLPAAFEDVERLLIIPLPDLMPNVRPPLHRDAIAAAVAAGVRHITYVSTVGARSSATDAILETHFATEQSLISSGVSWTFLRMGPYTDFLLDAANTALATGTYAGVAGASSASVVRDDVAAAAAGILTTTGHEGVTYHATGPVALSHADIAEVLSNIAGAPIRYSPLTIEQFEANLTSAGLPPPIIQVLSRFQAAARDGFFDLVTHDVERLSGSPAESIGDFLARNIKTAPARA